MPMQATATSKRLKGWYNDQVNSRLAAVYNGTEVFDFDANDMVVTQAISLSSTLAVTGAQTFTGAAEHSAAVGIADDFSLELGTDDDSVLRHKSGTLAADTALTDVVVGTVVAQALAANSLLISNTTADGDIAIYTQTGGNSNQAVFIDASAKIIAFGSTGWTHNIVNGSVKLTLGTASTFGTTQPTNALVLRAGTAPAGAITTAVGLFTDGTTMKKIIADGTVTDVQT